MSANTNNPLGRLHNILFEIANSKEYSPYKVFASIFNLDVNDKGSILACYAELFKLCEEARTLITNLPLNHEKFLSPINDSVLALSKINFASSNGLISMRDSLNDKLLTSLDLSSEVLAYTYSEKELDPSILKELSDSVATLKASISDSNINTELKTILINHLNNMNKSITKYKLYGVSGIKSELINTVGDIVVNQNLVITDDEKSFIEKLLNLMAKFNTIISFGKNLTPVIPAIMKFLN